MWWWLVQPIVFSQQNIETLCTFYKLRLRRNNVTRSALLFRSGVDFSVACGGSVARCQRY